MNKMKVKKNNFPVFTFKRKMNKKAIIWETFADVFLAGIVLFLAIFLSTLITNQTNKNIEDNIENKVFDMQSDEFFISYLNAEINNITFIDYITYYYIKQENLDVFTENVDSFFEEVYSTKVCWSLLINNNEFAKMNKCKKKEHLLDSTILVPLPDTYTMNLTLNITGYADEEE